MEQANIDFMTSFGSDPMAFVAISLPVIIMLLVLIGYVIAGRVINKNLSRSLDEDMVLPTDDDGEVLPSDPPKELDEWVVDEERESTTNAAPDTGAPSDVEEIRRDDNQSWLKRLSAGLAKTRDNLGGSLSSIFTGKSKINDEVLEQLHESLYRADIGVGAADKLVEHVRKDLGSKDAADWSEVSRSLKVAATEILQGNSKEITAPASGPFVVLICGVNGVGKTTSIGKLAARHLADGKKVLLCAADTYRAAAIDQLKVWGERIGVDVIAHKQGADPAAVAYDAVKAALARNVDILFIDTAGRLHNKNDLMAELSKINKVIGRDLPDAPHETWLVIDATTGQNAIQQVKAFSDVVDLSGLVVTKLDGTAKGGVLVAVTDQYKLPIRYIGIGEKAADLREFVPGDFAESLW